MLRLRTQPVVGGCRGYVCVVVVVLALRYDLDPSTVVLFEGPLDHPSVPADVRIVVHHHGRGGLAVRAFNVKVRWLVGLSLIHI